MKRSLVWFLAAAAWLGYANGGAVLAASSQTDSLTGYTGDSTLAGTQADLLTGGLTVANTGADPAVVFGPSGATFGVFTSGDGGRNYVRTTQADLATVNFKAQITIVASNIADQDNFFGLGTGDIALFGWPDWSTQASSLLMLPELNGSLEPKLTGFKTANDVNDFPTVDAPGLANGTHRLQIDFDATAKTVTFGIDLNYAGGPFAADVTNGPIDVSNLFAADGWPSEPSRIYFGGDDGIVFKDLAITVVPEPGSVALAALATVALGISRKRRLS